MNDLVEKYRSSLQKACDRINQKKADKALKDVVGNEFEQHRKRIWKMFGFKVDKNKHKATFKVDWTIYDKHNKVIAFEEDKGHYLDDCFAKRAIIDFAKTAQNYIKTHNKCPLLILHSFTRYKKFEKELENIKDILKPKIVEILKKNLIYITLTNHDRIRREWFSNAKDNCPYVEYAEDKLIKKDIRFIQSLQE